MKRFASDVIVVGAGTAGCYFAWQVAKAGFKVLVLEAKKLTDLGKHIEIFHMDEIRFKEFGIPKPIRPELIHVEDVGFTWSPDLQTTQPVKYRFYVMHMPSFIQRMQGYARKAGAILVENAKVTGILLEKGHLVGVSGRFGKTSFEAHAKLVVDASGLAAAVRTLLPKEFGVENKPVPLKDCLYVCLELRDRIPAGFPTGSNSYLYHKAFWNKSYGDGVILGIGQPKSFEHAWKQHKEWREEYFGDPGRVVARRQGAIPFHRPPFSLVGNGFMVIGDAANQNKPFSGEGCTSGFTAARIAAEVAVKTLKSGNVSRESMWDYNVRYFHGQGAKFAGGLAQLPAVAELTRRDVNYLFKHSIIFSSQDFEEMNLNYEIRMPSTKLLRIGIVLLWGVLTRQFKASSLNKFLGASNKAGRLKAHYLMFPLSPQDLPAWEAEAAQLWEL